MNYKNKLIKYLDKKGQFYSIENKYDIEISIYINNNFLIVYENFEEKEYIFDINDDFIWNKINNLKFKDILNNEFLENLYIEYKKYKLNELYLKYEEKNTERIASIYRGFMNLIPAIEHNKLTKEEYYNLYCLALKNVSWQRITLYINTIIEVINHNNIVGLEFRENNIENVLSDYELLKDIVEKDINTMKAIIEYLEEKEKYEILENMSKYRATTFFDVKNIDLAFKLLNKYQFINVKKHRKEAVLIHYLYKFIEHKKQEVKQEILTSSQELKKSYITILEYLCDIGLTTEENKNKFKLFNFDVFNNNKKEHFLKLSEELLNEMSFIEISENFKLFEETINLRKILNNF